MSKPEKSVTRKKPGMSALLKPYRKSILALVGLALASNALSLLFPKIVSRSIDTFIQGNFSYEKTIIEFSLLALGILVFTFLLNVVQIYTSERVARDLRAKLSQKISQESYLFIQKTSPSKLLTYLTSDVDAVKMFVAQAVASLISSVVIIVGASIMLLAIQWKLGLAVIAIVPIIAMTFFVTLARVRVLFKESREVIDWLNKVMNESILGAALIRVVHARKTEQNKFDAANTDARRIGLRILNLFAAMIPIVTFVANLGTLIILALGGYFVVNSTMSIGDFAAFTSYVAILVFPIFIVGFTMNIISQATASYQRIVEVLDAEEIRETGILKKELRGDIDVKDVTVTYGEKSVLKHVSFSLASGTKTAIIGPTAAGKSQLLSLLTGLTVPTLGSVAYDQHPIAVYDSEMLHRQIGFVFQESIMFNMSIKENIAFSDAVTDASLEKAVETAELNDFLATLPDGLATVISERGSSLSGGQKQRIMLARALALNPKILLLDDFTARVDGKTEGRILANIEKNYPGITLVSVTQKIASVEHYDEIIVLMEGEVLARGTHEQLLNTSPEYVQIFDSQRSTNSYELHA